MLEVKCQRCLKSRVKDVRSQGSKLLDFASQYLLVNLSPLHSFLDLLNVTIDRKYFVVLVKLLQRCCL